jgi:hypothetical protein
MEKKSSGYGAVGANSTEGQGSRRAVVPSDDDETYADLDRRFGTQQCDACRISRKSALESGKVISPSLRLHY